MSALTGAEAAEAARTVKALAEPTRLQLLALLTVHGPSRQVELVDRLAAGGRVLEQARVSHHLRVLVAAGLVERSAVGRPAWAVVPERFYELAGLLRGRTGYGR